MPKSIAVSERADQMIEQAMNHIQGMAGKRYTRKEALDWLLRDMAEYGSPTCGNWARRIYHDTLEASEGMKLQHEIAGYRMAIENLATQAEDALLLVPNDSGLSGRLRNAIGAARTRLHPDHRSR
jgi:hypothetical protein